MSLVNVAATILSLRKITDMQFPLKLKCIEQK